MWPPAGRSAAGYAIAVKRRFTKSWPRFDANCRSPQPPPIDEDRPRSQEMELVVGAAPESAQTVDPEPVASPGAPVPEATRSRGSRYYQSRARSERPSARPTSLRDLDVLRSIQASGDVANLILTFGPHAGETPGQVARTDPDYLRRLALSAQRPDVRAAAARLVDALPRPPSAHYGRLTAEITSKVDRKDDGEKWRATLGISSVVAVATVARSGWGVSEACAVRCAFTYRVADHECLTIAGPNASAKRSRTRRASHKVWHVWAKPPRSPSAVRNRAESKCRSLGRLHLHKQDPYVLRVAGRRRA